jgi:transcriptional regulator with XRE-family HTH domain
MLRVGKVTTEKRLAARVGAEIRTLRERAGLSTRQLAQAAGMSQAFLSQIERGLSAPSMASTYRLAEALGVVPGALLPPLEGTSPVTFVPAGEGRTLPVAGRADAAVGRALVMESGKALEVVEYVIEPGQYIEEWFQLDGELAVYLVSGALDVEVEDEGTWRLGPRDLIAHPAGIRHRWLLVDGRPAHVLLSIAHPEGAVGGGRGRAV